MFQYTFEIVTAITIAVISVILVLYFIVLKRKGWLTEDTNGQNEPFYRCPNQECRKIFEKPIVLNDLSHSGSRVHSACPHCGFDLKTLPQSTVENKAKVTIRRPISSTKSWIKARKSTHTKPATPTESTKTSDARSRLQARPPECSHFLGYLRKVPKNSTMPDHCFSCPKMVACISYEVS